MSDLIETSCLGRTLRYRPLRARTPDGLDLAVQDWGRGTCTRDVLLIHGFSQSHLAWLKQVSGPLAEAFRLVSFDIRGHGLSDKPGEAEAYRDPGRWADDVRSVIAQAGLVRPVLVVWSYAGRIALDYLQANGDADIAGLVMVAATSSGDPALLGPAIGALRRMGAADLGASLDATRDLLVDCTVRPLPADEFALMMGYNAMTPPAVRRALAGRPAEYDGVLRNLSVPVLTVHGAADRVNLPAMSEHTNRRVRNGRALVYREVGHLPFWEDAARFDADLAAFLRGLP
ncbi:MAG TPA: alpha/beta hydrolase [Burkholderiaceae bacterium]|nr:alpha/beta hydrolase [Burkholderiaceae bacterium]